MSGDLWHFLSKSKVSEKMRESEVLSVRLQRQMKEKGKAVFNINKESREFSEQIRETK